MYNLSDIIRFKQKRALSLPSSSIAYRYISQIEKPLLGGEFIGKRGPPVDFDLLSAIVADVKAEPVPKDYFSIHLRLGDRAGRILVQSYINLIKKHELDSKYKGATLFWGIHNGKGVKKSTEYIDNLTRAIKRLGLKVSIRSGEVDKDLKSLAESPCLILSVGGFSWLAGSLNPHHVIWDHQAPPRFPWVDRSRPNTHRRLNQLRLGYNYQKE